MGGTVQQQQQLQFNQNPHYHQSPKQYVYPQLNQQQMIRNGQYVAILSKDEPVINIACQPPLTIDRFESPNQEEENQTNFTVKKKSVFLLK